MVFPSIDFKWTYRSPLPTCARASAINSHSANEDREILNVAAGSVLPLDRVPYGNFGNAFTVDIAGGRLTGLLECQQFSRTHLR